MNQQQSDNTDTKQIDSKRYQKDLPLSIKNFLSPNATIKAHRRANYLYRHSHDKIDTNLLIFLHGAGDTHLPYHELAKNMKLPQTATLSINANSMGGSFVTLPFDLGCTWFEEMNYQTGDVLSVCDSKRITSLNHACEKLDALIDKISGETQSWIPERVFLFGFSAGACAIMHICCDRRQSGKRPLGGAICVAGGLNGITKKSQTSNNNNMTIESTPLLLIGGENDQSYPISVMDRDGLLYRTCNDSINNVSVKTFVQSGKGHEMIKHREETKCIMEFLGEKMIRRSMAMEGFSEVTSFDS